MCKAKNSTNSDKIKTVHPDENGKSLGLLRWEKSILYVV